MTSLVRFSVLIQIELQRNHEKQKEQRLVSR